MAWAGRERGGWRRIVLWMILSSNSDHFQKVGKKKHWRRVTCENLSTKASLCWPQCWRAERAWKYEIAVSRGLTVVKTKINLKWMSISRHDASIPFLFSTCNDICWATSCVLLKKITAWINERVYFIDCSGVVSLTAYHLHVFSLTSDPRSRTYRQRGGSVVEWLGRRTWNPEVKGSGPALTTKLKFFVGRPKFK